MKLRVKQGRAPLPYNDGETTRMVQPGETFEIPDPPPEALVRTLQGWVEVIDDQGNLKSDDEQMTPDRTDLLRRARPHERVTMLQEFKAAREKQHVEELKRLDDQIAAEQKAADEEAEEKRRRMAEAKQHQTPVPQPPTGDAVPAAVKPGKPEPAVERKSQ